MTTQTEAFDAYCKTLNPLWNTVTSRTYAEQFFYAGFEAAQTDNTAKLYEELRSIIDGGSESFTHEDAVQYLKDKLTQSDCCGEPDQCWEPCGELGKSEEHVKVAQPEQETQAYREAAQLAKWLFKTHYAQEEHYASGRVVWGLCDTTTGVISQIDNMVCKLVREPEQEPVAWAEFDGEGGYHFRAYENNEDYAEQWDKRNPNHVGWVKPLYTTPPQRTWAGLTYEYFEELWERTGDYESFAIEIEAKLKEKNT